MGSGSEMRSRVSELVRTAEQQLLSGHPALALERLRHAQQLDPENQYIQAIIQRAEVAGQKPPAGGPVPAHQSSRYLSITVGREGGTEGSPGSSGPMALSQEDTRRRIRQLTDTAQVLLNRGLNESAFDTLMRAYLLDPLNPDVLSCEQRVLPAWQDLQRLRSNAGTPVISSTPAERIQSLRREELSLRNAKERHLWRALSGPPPRTTDSDHAPGGSAEPAMTGKSTRRRKP